MTTFGKNMKLTAARERRAAMHAVLTEGLGCQSQEPAPDLTLYRLDDGFNLGVYFVDAANALDEAALRFAPWLELAVGDVEATVERLVRLGASTVEYHDREHVYLQLPGGPVFRLSQAEPA